MTAVPRRVVWYDAAGRRHEADQPELISLLQAAEQSLPSLPAVVAVRLPSGLPCLLATLACKRRQVTFVHLGGDTSDAREQIMLRIAGATHMIVPLPDSETAFSVRRLSLDGAFAPSPYAYIMFTSGTTGPPKPVRVPHRCIDSNIASLVRRLSLSRDDTLVQLTPPTFDPCLVEMLGAAAAEASLIIPPPSARSDPFFLSSLLAAERVTLLATTPSLFSRFDAADRTRIWSGHLRAIVLGGEPFPPRPIFAQWHTEGCTADLFNIYGTTECSIWAALHRVTFDSYIDDAHCVIGEPLDDTELHVRDGRLFIGGEARLCHVSDEAQPQLLRFTGDLVEKAINSFVIIGRADRQVKRQGGRFNLDEIEAAARSCFEVNSARALLRGQVIFLFIAGGDHGHVVKHLASVLPPFALPDIVHVVSEIPVTVNGKADDAALLKVVGGNLAGNAAEVFCDSLRAVLKMEGDWMPGKDDVFVAIGGTSLDALRVAESVRPFIGNWADADVHSFLVRLLHEPLTNLLSDLLSDLESSRKRPRSDSDSQSSNNISRYPTGHIDTASSNKDDSSDQVSSRGHNNTHDTSSIHIQDASYDNDTRMACASLSFSDTILSPTSSMRVTWRFPLGKCIDGSPVSRGHIAYIGSHSGLLAAVSTANGHSYWTIDLGARIEGSPALSLDGSLVIIGTHDGHVYAIDAKNGAKKWAARTNGIVKCTPLVVGDRVFFGAHDHVARAVDVATGEATWMRVLDGAVVAAPRAIGREKVVFATLGGSVHVVDAATGDLVWSRGGFKPIFAAVALVWPRGEVQEILGDSSTQEPGKPNVIHELDLPDIQDPRGHVSHESHDLSFSDPRGLLVPAVDGTLCLLSLSGDTIWRERIGSTVYSSPVVCGGVAWLGADDGVLRGYDAASGRLVVEDRLGDGHITAAPTCVMLEDGGSIIVIASTDAVVHVVHVKDGKVERKESVRVDSKESFSSPVVMRDMILIGTRGDVLVGIQLE